MPLAGITTVLVMVLVAIFFVSGADAASIVMGSLSERGSHDPRRSTELVERAVVAGADQYGDDFDLVTEYHKPD